MADNAAPPQGDQPRQVPARFDDSRAALGYANTFRTTLSPSELVLDFGMLMPEPSGGVVLGISNRVILNWASAKNLAANLVNAVRQYEQQYGEIQMGPRNPQGGGPRLAQ